MRKLISRKIVIIITLAVALCLLDIQKVAAVVPANSIPQLVYDEIGTFYKEGMLSPHKGPVASTIVLSSDPSEGTGRIILRFQDEIVSVGNKAVTTPEEFKEALKPYEGGAGLPITIKIIAAEENGVRKERIETVQTIKEVRLLMKTDFFSDQELIDLSLMNSFFSETSQEVLQKQLTFVDRTDSGQSVEYGCFKFTSSIVGPSQARQARLVLSPMEIEYRNSSGANETINLVPGDVFIWLGAPCVSLYGKPQNCCEVLMIAHNSKVSTKVLSLASLPHFGHWEIDWNRPVRLGPQRLMIRATRCT